MTTEPFRRRPLMTTVTVLLLLQGVLMCPPAMFILVIGAFDLLTGYGPKSLHEWAPFAPGPVLGALMLGAVRANTRLPAWRHGWIRGLGLELAIFVTGCVMWWLHDGAPLYSPMLIFPATSALAAVGAFVLLYDRATSGRR
ncbi:hypothetical protein [Actinomadura harenae]|uniref:Uncharacterized protein n=1 Tax=Actinomadura harenae TaxID=2483351 RepID=A0A3M2LX88_9ACTN|nr:hypothetical protein [Actinomadura harenae]RMI42194.1 hypothetical protein EBO15_20400 [Actinomadura harenae]